MVICEMVDIHNHILPGVDDGAKNMEETKRMLSIAVDEGITDIIATSHGEAGVGKEQAQRYRNAYIKVKRYIASEEIPVRLYYGNELYYSDGIIEALYEEEVYTLNGTQYVLVEFPVYESYSYIERGLRNLQNIGCCPILAHVERYEVLRDVRKVRRLVEQGICIQVNASSIVGKAGWSIKQFCLKLMREELIHIVATDAHGCRHRRPVAKECLAYIEKKKGKRYRILISEKNPRKILKGEVIVGKT